MRTTQRHHVRVVGDGERTIVFAHGYGCDQNMWRLLLPDFERTHRVVLFDLVGSGRSDLSCYDRDRYSHLQGHADDVLEIIEEHASGDVVFVGHSVSAMIGLLAGVAQPKRFAAQVMIGPSPCYVNDGDYVGGFSRNDIDSLLETLDSNYLGWASAMAPAIMGAPDQPALGVELTNSFCATDPEISKHFARTTFLSDNRADVPKLSTRTLVLQSTDDLIAPQSVGAWMAKTLPNATLRLIDNIGHCPHLSAPRAISKAIHDFL